MPAITGVRSAATGDPLLPLELRRALLGEGLGALLGVVRREDRPADVELDLQRLVLRERLGRTYRALDGLDGERSVGPDHRRDLERLVERLAVGDDVADEPDLLGLLRRHRPC